ncbi:MAG: PIN domain-containing protein [Thermoanaerobaculia bacterium]
MKRSLVDTSAWVDFLRGERAAVARVGDLLGEGGATICGPIAAEVLSGARTSAEYTLLRELAEGLDWVAEPGSLWPRVADYRFALARSGFRAGLIDLAIAATAFDAGLPLVTRDRGFERIRTVVPIELDLF